MFSSVRYSAFLWGYAVFQTIAGSLVVRLGPRRVLAVAVLWWGIFTALTAAVPASLARALAMFIGIRFLLGAGESIIYPASNQFVARWIPVDERGIANGWIFAGVGAGISPPLITRVMLHHGWRASFWVCAAIGIVAGAIWFAIARDTPGQHPWVSAGEKQKIDGGLTLASLSTAAPPQISRSREFPGAES
jgi:MFS transporter, ACS family, glucarate transporter